MTVTTFCPAEIDAARRRQTAEWQEHLATVPHTSGIGCGDCEGYGRLIENLGRWAQREDVANSRRVPIQRTTADSAMDVAISRAVAWKEDEEGSGCLGWATVGLFAVAAVVWTVIAWGGAHLIGGLR